MYVDLAETANRYLFYLTGWSASGAGGETGAGEGREGGGCWKR